MTALLLRCLHRLLLVVVALVFASSSSLAAMPLVWCVGADGHQGIEYKVAGRHAEHQMPGQLGLPAAAVPDAASADLEACRDWHLLDAAKGSSVPVDAGVLTFDLRAVVAPPQLRVASEPTPRDMARARRLQPPATAPPDLQRIALRTVVLLI